MLNDCEISPTNYMIAFLRQRGWTLPDSTMRIPNVIPEVDPVAAQARLCCCCSLLVTLLSHAACAFPVSSPTSSPIATAKNTLL